MVTLCGNNIKMNLADPELELIDPTPNIHSLFIHFDKLFFWTKLASRAVVRWSKRMYSCAGICSYEGRGGLCDIALSEPLLKLRPRKDLVETLLHEMIHAFLFITSRDRDRDGHGPNFQAHMHRINKLAGVNITIYHDFHDEVKLYLTHWWRCDGPCQSRKPYFGVVRRSCNRAPGPNDYWWKMHQTTCGGTFVKIKEPENYAKRKTQNPKQKPSGNIIKFINNDKTLVEINKGAPTNNKQIKGVLKDSNNSTGTTKPVIKTNSNGTILITQNWSPSPVIDKKVSPLIEADTISGRKRTQSANVVETVRNIWAHKQLPTMQSTNLESSNRKRIVKPRQSFDNDFSKTNKHKSEKTVSSPPSKIKKIDDYFKKVATNVLKDIYGEDFKVSQSIIDNKLIATKAKMVECPICKMKVNDEDINKHLDECLNKDVIEKLSKDTIPKILQETKAKVMPNRSPVVESKKDSGKTLAKWDFNSTGISSSIEIKKEIFDDFNIADISCIKKETSIVNFVASKRGSIVDIPNSTTNNEFDERDMAKVKSIAKKVNYEKHLQKTDETKSVEGNLNFGYLPSFLDDIAAEIKLPAIKTEPGSSVSKFKCPCCDQIIDRPIQEHLDDCLAFFANSAAPEESSTSFANETIVIDDDDDVFDDSQTFNATGTKSPCPCCLTMVEQADMNDHLDVCLSS